ncbi:elongation factor Ts [Enterovibrio baiacu]|uniref:elongation factor Ts n=1 Tax=Enterovibrio baiacu TaxID=2491023 RepID=UPI001012F2FA|nr:elongation factor Ts [Enterovibrio baiacu]MBE1275503.1 elongation factor Ts [Enterovibrio baiacu]
MGTVRKQKEIKYLLKVMSWSHRELAGAVFEYDNDDFVEDEKQKIAKLSDAIKKQLTRTTTAEARLDHYLEVIESHPSFNRLKLDSFRPKYVSHDCLEDDLLLELTATSQHLDEE